MIMVLLISQGIDLCAVRDLLMVITRLMLSVQKLTSTPISSEACTQLKLEEEIITIH